MQIDRGRRHPLCPYCRYDLVATVRVGGDVCPECGESFEPHELVRETRPGDWTDAIGLKRLGVSLLIRGAIGLGIWGLWLWVVSLITINTVLLVIAVLVGHVVVGIVIARIIWTRLRERSGFDGLLPAVAALAGDWLVLIAGGILIGRVTSMSGAHAALAVFEAGLTAVIVILPPAFLDE